MRSSGLYACRSILCERPLNLALEVLVPIVPHLGTPCISKRLFTPVFARTAEANELGASSMEPMSMTFRASDI